ncbi:hypothetical protein [Streptomyces sp. NPDC088246]|uniref:hypothetical protein n=1 Tax=Streptomyces sp. NPDC088246 TaxID=3365842 RepID=UPI003806C171
MTPSPTTYAPNTATATTGGVTVTATAKVTTIRWDMGDGTTVTCHSPGTPYDAFRGKSPSPTCGHLYQKTSHGHPDERYQGTVTATLTVTWSPWWWCSVWNVLMAAAAWLPKAPSAARE